MIGLPLQFGPGRIVRLLFDKNKLRATGCFLFGLFLVMRGNSFLGILIEIFGFCNLFMCVGQGPSSFSPSACEPDMGAFCLCSAGTSSPSPWPCWATCR